MTDGLPDPAAFGAAFEDFVRAMSAAAERPESPLAARLRDHLGTDPAALPTTAAEFATTDHPNLQLAVDAVLPDAEVVGVNIRHAGMAPVSLGDVIAGIGVTGPIRPGPVQAVAIEVGDGRVISCVATGIYLARHGGAPVALVLSRSERGFGGAILKVEGVSSDPDAVPAVLGELRAAMREHNVYRGRVISLLRTAARASSSTGHSRSRATR
jgi:cell division protease FtsH